MMSNITEEIEQLIEEIEQEKSLIVTLNNNLYETEEEMDNFNPADHLSEEEFDNYLDEMQEIIEVGGISFNPSRILSELDPIAYSEAFSDWASFYEKEDIQEYIELNDLKQTLEDDLADADETADFPEAQSHSESQPCHAQNGDARDD